MEGEDDHEVGRGARFKRSNFKVRPPLASLCQIRRGAAPQTLRHTPPRPKQEESE